MKYIDRKGNITIEENEQDKFLRHLYNDRGGRLCLKLLIRPFVSKAAGVLLNTRLSARFVPDFVKNNKIDLSIYEKQNFSSWNDFFIRRIRKEERPIDMRENILISPCDGKLSVHRISSDSRFSIKDTEYTVGQLLKNKAIAERYTGGYALIFRLTVDDYHHYCYVADGRKSANGNSARRFPHSESCSKRCISHLQRKRQRIHSAENKTIRNHPHDGSRRHDGRKNHKSP